MTTTNLRAKHAVPTREEVAASIRRHCDYWAKRSGEDALLLRNSELSTLLQYAGRVAFELVQNALDRAERRVWVSLVENGEEATLLVGNDGRPVTTDQDFDYTKQVTGRRRADLNALLSLHTSNKSPDESLGNKGIGFRSVFDVSDRVQVWSRCRDEHTWWGVELLRPATPSAWLSRLMDDPAARRGAEMCWPGSHPQEILGTDDDAERASFALPVPLLSDSPPHWLGDRDDLVTLVVVPVREQSRDDVRSHLDELVGARLHFVGLRPEKRRISVEMDIGDRPRTHATWPAIEQGGSWTVFSWRSSKLAHLAKKAGHGVTVPGVAVAWPPPPTSAVLMGEAKAKSDESATPVDRSTWLYNYLPTRLRPDFDVDVHGDFQVKADRTSMGTGNTAIGRYNTALSEAAAELHLSSLLSSLGRDRDIFEPSDWKHLSEPDAEAVPSRYRLDLWRLLHPRPRGQVFLLWRIWELLFRRMPKTWAECYEPYAALAAAFFGHSLFVRDDGRPELPAWVFRDFWDASTAWVMCVTGCGPHTSTWKKAASALCEALRRAEVRCLPIAEQSELAPETLLVGDRLPDTPGPSSGTRAKRRVYLRRAGSESLVLPKALLDRGSSITAFPLDDFGDRDHRPTGAREFGRWTVLQELRQLPNKIAEPPSADLHSDPVEAAIRQRELIRLASDLFTAEMGKRNPPSRTPGRFGFGWRADGTLDHTDEIRAAGRSLATLYLPKLDGGWEPARQLHAGQIDLDELGALPEEVVLHHFLLFLGVAPEPPVGAPPLLLVEGGTESLVPARDVPPALSAPGTTALQPLQLALSRAAEREPTTLAPSILAAWSRHLRPLVRAEAEADGEASSSALGETLRATPWVPVGPQGWVVPPREAVRLMGVRPDLVVLSPRHDRRAPVTYHLPSDRDETLDLVSDVLEALGGVPSLASSALKHDEGMPARRLLGLLRESYPDLSALEPATRRPVLDLAQELVEAAAACPVEDDWTPPIPVHAPVGRDAALDSRPVRWADNREIEGWIVTPEHQELVRRFFPEVPLSSVTLGPRVIERVPSIAHRAVVFNQTIGWDDQGSSDDTLAVEVAGKLFEALPGLLALAHSSRMVVPDEDRVRQRWGSGPAGPLHHVQDVWIDFALKGPDVPARPWNKGSFGDVVLMRPSRLVRGDPLEGARILFDVDPENGLGPNLADYGDALAELTVNNKALGPLFARALAELERDPTRAAWQRLLEREGTGDLVEQYRRALEPMTAEEERVFRRRVSEVLATAGAVLDDAEIALERLRRLGANDLRPLGRNEWGGTTSNTISRVLEDVEWPDRAVPFRPILVVENENRRAWDSWLAAGRRGARLDAFVLHHARRAGAEDLTAPVLRKKRNEWLEHRGFPLLDFSAPEIAADWLRSLLAERPEGFDARALDGETLDAALREFAPRYQPVRADALVSLTQTAWTTADLQANSPSGLERTPGTAAGYAADQAARTAIGDEAERALLTAIASRTHNVLHRADEDGDLDRAIEALFKAVPDGGRTREALEQAIERWRAERSPDALRDGLHISKIWGNAGFDLLGLESDETGRIVPVRYECKGLPEGSGQVRVHLSDNERAVATKVRQAEANSTEGDRHAGRWKLIGVEPSGRAVDLTPMVSDLLDEPDDLLRPLYSRGLAPYGLVLRVSRCAKAASNDED